MPEWQPIETAPKDGAVILVCKRPPKYGRGNWKWGSVRLASWQGTYWLLMHQSGQYAQDDDLTGWMPLPEPPEQSDA